MKVVLLPEALAEIDAAVAYYERQRPGLGFDFFLELSDMIELIAERPELGEAVPVSEPPALRRFVLKRFPFVLWVESEGEDCRLAAVAHASRRPGYWRERL